MIDKIGIDRVTTILKYHNRDLMDHRSDHKNKSISIRDNKNELYVIENINSRIFELIE